MMDCALCGVFGVVEVRPAAPAPAAGTAAGEENERECPACGGPVCHPQSIARRVEENDETKAAK
jgi:hypothetical protein